MVRHLLEGFCLLGQDEASHPIIECVSGVCKSKLISSDEGEDPDAMSSCSFCNSSFGPLNENE